MTSLEFISSAISSTAWPITAIVIVWLLRGDVGEVLKSLNKFKYKELEADFREVLDKSAIGGSVSQE